VRCGAVRCGAVRCGAVRCGAVLRVSPASFAQSHFVIIIFFYKKEFIPFPLAGEEERKMTMRASFMEVASSTPGSESPVLSVGMSEVDETTILAHINHLLEMVNISAHPISSVVDLRKSGSSMFVAIFEALFRVRLDGIERRPTSLTDYVNNAQVVVDALSARVLDMSLSHIEGQAIVSGDLVAIRNLVDILMGICEVKSSQDREEQHQGREGDDYEDMVRQLEEDEQEEERRRLEVVSRQERHSAPAGRRTKGSSSSKKKKKRKEKNRPKSWPVTGKTQPKIVVPAVALAERELKASEAMPGRIESVDPIRKAEGGAGTKGAVLRKSQAEKIERERRMRVAYRGVLRDRLSSLRRREAMDARKQYHSHRNARHATKVRNIKRQRVQEDLRRAKTAVGRRTQDQHASGLVDLYKKIVAALHQQKREDDKEDAARLKALYESSLVQEEDIERFLKDRMCMIKEHAKQAQHERAVALKAEERLLTSLLTIKEKAHETLVTKQLEKLEQYEESVLMRSLEQHAAYAELLGVEDWSTVLKDRVLTPKLNSTFEKRVKSTRASADAKRRHIRQKLAARRLAHAYGAGPRPRRNKHD
jgi:hypothetical protein